MTSLFRKLFKVRKCRYGCANFCGDHTCCYHCIIKDSCILSCKHPNYNYHYSDCGSCLGWGFDDVKVLNSFHIYSYADFSVYIIIEKSIGEL